MKTPISLPPKCWTAFPPQCLNFCLLHRIWRHWKLLCSGMWHHADWYINAKIFRESCCLHLQNSHQHHCGNLKSCFLGLNCYWLLLICLQLQNYEWQLTIQVRSPCKDCKIHEIKTSGRWWSSFVFGWNFRWNQPIGCWFQSKTGQC